MSPTLIGSNLLAYSLQVGLLVALAAFVPALVRMRAAGARLLYWQMLLAACLLLPWVRPWHRQVIAASVSVTTVVTSIATPAPAPPRFHIPPGELLLYLLAAGAVARLAWLGAGFWRLHRYRRCASPLENSGLWAEVLLSAEVSSPVTFGWRRPVILLPERFPRLSEPMQRAILCHENLHVERRDWLFTVAEELVRAALWFHPAVWWVLGEIQLAREQAVDCRVVQITRSRDPYVDALLEMAGARPELDLAPAPLFLRKRHLKQRVVEIIREATMSKTRWITALAVSVLFLAGACWVVTGAFPLAAAPQMVSDAPGVAVDLGGAQIVHRSGVEYPAAAIAKGVQGTVVAQVKLDDSGAVIDASILSGPDELRKAVLQSVLNWHFTKDAAGGTRRIRVVFELPKEGAALPSMAVSGGATHYLPYGSVTADRLIVNNGVISTGSASVLRSILVTGISKPVTDLLALLPVRAEDTLPANISEVMAKVGEAVAKFDPHLRVAISIHNGVAMMRISPDEPAASGNGVVAGIQSTAALTLRVEPSGSDLLLTWNRDCEAIAGATHGVLSISDGDRHEHFDMDARQLTTGNVAYAPVTGDVSFKLEVTGKNQTTTTESVRSVRTRPSIIPDGTSTNANPAAPELANPTPSRVFAGSGAQASLLIHQVSPVYPPLAKQARVQGTVVLSAIIGKDGRPHDLHVLSGHPLLFPAAMEAVKDWVYQPTLMDGEPVEVKTAISVNFTLPPENGESSHRSGEEGAVQPPTLISRVEPQYPEAAKQMHAQGPVALRVTIGKDGLVRDIEVVSGHPLLVQAAKDAVRKWVFSPKLVDGEPVESQSFTELNFTMVSSENAETPMRFDVGGSHSQNPQLISRVEPVYPPEARQAGIHGQVVLRATIGRDGAVEDVEVLSGDPILAKASIEAVKKWRYRPTLVNGEPVETKTQISMNFVAVK